MFTIYFFFSLYFSGKIKKSQRGDSKMKKALFLLSLLLLLSGCREAPVPEPEEPPQQTAAAEPQPAPEADPVQPDPSPEEAVQPASKAQTAAFLWQDTALSKDGTVVLQVPDHTLRFLLDQITQNPRYLLAQDHNSNSTSLYTLDGSFLQQLDGQSIFLAGAVCWTGSYGNQVLQSFPEGETLVDGLHSVIPVRDRLALIPSFQRSSIVLWDPVNQVEALRLEPGFQKANLSYPWSGSGYLPVTSPAGDGVNLIDSQGSPLLASFQADILEIAYGYAIVRPTESSQSYTVIDLSTQQELPQTVFRADREFLPLPQSALICEADRQWTLVDWQGNRLYEEAFLDRPILLEEDGIPQYLIGQVLRETAFVPVIVSPDGKVLGELPADPVELGPVSSQYLLYVTDDGSQQTAYLRELDTGTDILLARGSRILLGGLQRSGDGSEDRVLRFSTSGGRMLALTVDGQLRLYLNDGTPGRLDLGDAVYLGDDVFSTQDGLRYLDGSWLYQP